MAKRHFAIGYWALLLAGAPVDTMLVAVKPAKAVFGAKIVYH
ncbi:MAG TPA: hypothetical protein VH277_14720 [Gemmatimonadaceae bacterium]|nr:hypothetical protein [Gemmatimonadaceae bacterium]